MKSIFIIFTILLSSTLCLNSQARNLTDVSLIIEGVQAKKIYNSLIGPAVQEEGAAGHLYRQGKSILCRRITADMDDNHSIAIPTDDPRRYSCKMQFDSNGRAISGQ